MYRKIRAEEDRSMPRKDLYQLLDSAKKDMDTYFFIAKESNLMVENAKTKKWMEELLYDNIWHYVTLEGK